MLAEISTTPIEGACYRKNGHVFRVDGIRDGLVEAARSSAAEPEKRAVRFSFGLAVWERYMRDAQELPATLAVQKPLFEEGM